MYAQHYSRFLRGAVADPLATPSKRELLHFASHSHHPWPDATRDAQLKVWDDAVELLDRKWGKSVFSRVVPDARQHIQSQLGLKDASRTIFAPNTHEFLARLFSCLLPRLRTGRDVRILTTDGEYHSAMWQFQRWKELPGVYVDRVPVEPFDTFEARYVEAAGRHTYDMAHFSHVFFNLGFAADFEKIVGGIQGDNTMIVVDGYHGFMAKPTSLKNVEDRVFYLAGGYKYAQAGEGACFMVVPTHCPWSPYDIGWFSMFGALAAGLDFSKSIPFSNDADKFWGATFDPTGLYRFNAVMDFFSAQGMTVPVMDAYVRGLQEYFLKKLGDHPLSWLSEDNLITPRDLTRAGHFLSFRLADASLRERALEERNVLVDSRIDFLRFGFGVYQDQPMIDRLFDVLRDC